MSCSAAVAAAAVVVASNSDFKLTNSKLLECPFPFRSRFVALNKHHAYFLLVDNATVGKYGAEIALRRKLERFISTQRLSANFSTPLVCLVIEGGTNTIRAVLEYVTDTPPVPVVVCDGTGRAADLIAFAHK